MVWLHPVIARFGSVELYTYGLLLGIGFIVAGTLAAREAGRRGHDPDEIYYFMIVSFILGVVLSRALYVLLNWSEYAGNPLLIFNTRSGGMTIHGALLGGLIAAVLTSRKMKMTTLELLDIVAIPLPLAQSIGRWGCLFNGCCYGVPTGGSWGVLTRFAPGLRHPTQIYESVLCFVLFGVLWRIKDRRYNSGVLFALYLVGYSVIRFAVEFFRDSPKNLAFGMSQAQVGSIAIAAVALVFIAIRSRARIRQGSPDPNSEPRQ
ncbi:MAG TPA: prolipoprotein diacylglyceryl transferase [Firmicutes bacterium]|nr:prolipoprotein diacylglyceryl transferase [Bacillota bacterium]